jgi:hypothetical protein
VQKYGSLWWIWIRSFGLQSDRNELPAYLTPKWMILDFEGATIP